VCLLNVSGQAVRRQALTHHVVNPGAPDFNLTLAHILKQFLGPHGAGAAVVPDAEADF